MLRKIHMQVFIIFILFEPQKSAFAFCICHTDTLLPRLSYESLNCCWLLFLMCTYWNIIMGGMRVCEGILLPQMSNLQFYSVHFLPDIWKFEFDPTKIIHYNIMVCWVFPNTVTYYTMEPLYSNKDNSLPVILLFLKIRHLQ